MIFMITKEKYAQRRFFFRDHAGRRGRPGPSCGEHELAGLVGLACGTGTELVKPDRELGDKSRQDGRLRSMI
ncbi:MAG: hypothetical protein WAV12_08595, partial [Trebonia sp.]|uniref:hypothetical protein n=1 Tax=Trebonia sp. TaxID=2767075 RepID=UPI003BB1CD43